MVPLVVNILVVRMGPDLPKFVERTQEKQQACSHRANDHERKQHGCHPGGDSYANSLVVTTILFSDGRHGSFATVSTTMKRLAAGDVYNRIVNVYTSRIYTEESMGTARVFRSGNSQAVRLPKEFRLKSKEVEIFRRGREIVLREKENDMKRAFDLILGLPDDLVLPDRKKDVPQEREGL